MWYAWTQDDIYINLIPKNIEMAYVLNKLYSNDRPSGGLKIDLSDLSNH